MIAAARGQPLEEGHADVEPDFDGTDWFAFVADDGDPARSDPGPAAFEPRERGARRVGIDHRLAEAREIVAALFQLVDADERGRRGEVKLHLRHAGGRLHVRKPGAGQLFERPVVLRRDGRLDDRERRDHLGLGEGDLVGAIDRGFEPGLGGVEITVMHDPQGMLLADEHAHPPSAW